MDRIHSDGRKRVTVFFYGSFIRMEILAKAGFKPTEFEVVRLSGFDIHISPHASLSRSDQRSVYGIAVKPTHDDLNRLYSMEGVGTFLPEAVLIEKRDGTLEPALCYIPPSREDKPADLEYLRNLIAAARQYGFPDWYVQRLERFQH